MTMRFALLLGALVLLAGCADRKDTDKIEQRHQQQMIRMG